MIEEVIRAIHSEDKQQLEAIFSNEQYVLVEAPAGYGKTKTMISRIAYLIASKKLPGPKKILALTFSVNAAYKIKQDVSEKLPKILLKEKISPLDIKSKALSTNYHGFCRRILRLYGYLLDASLKQIDFMMGTDDSNKEDLLKLGLPQELADKVVAFNNAIKEANGQYIQDNRVEYLGLVKKYFLPKNYIPFNSILLFSIELFDSFKNIQEFYQSYFPVVIVDEFQDTNILSWILLDKLISKKTNAMFIGDPLQRIYGFIGAIPGLMEETEEKYKAFKIELKTNYRFNDNKDLLQLDKNIRENAKNPRKPNISSDAELLVYKWKNQKEEANGISKLVQFTLSKDPSSRTAILVKRRGPNTDEILTSLYVSKIDFFFALYSDEDIEYVEFHQKCLQKFLEVVTSAKQKLNRSIAKKFLEKMKSEYLEKKSELSDSLLKLLDVFLNTVFSDYKFLSIDEKIEFIRDTFESRALKQYLDYINSKIMISTIHGAKGLEWDYVILPDMEQFSFPSWLSLCGRGDKCQFMEKCELSWDYIKKNSEFEKCFYEELSVFYVGVTRAKKNVLCSFSDAGIRYNGQEKRNNPSCLLKLKGILYLVKELK